MDSSDTGAIVLGWLARLTLILGVLGLVAFDAISVAVARLGVIDDAKAAAVAGVHAYQETGSADRAYEASLITIRALNARDEITPGTFTVTRDGRVTLMVQREATTVVAHHVPAVKDRLIMRAGGEAKP